MKKGIIDDVLETNFETIILDEKKNFNFENQIDQLLSNFKNSHFKSLISNL